MPATLIESIGKWAEARVSSENRSTASISVDTIPQWIVFFLSPHGMLHQHISLQIKSQTELHRRTISLSMTLALCEQFCDYYCVNILNWLEIAEQ